ncbi:MAG: hypothetical protein IKJ79_06360 [Bacteroidaceae bacterium]|nr:hypothetical protein [Bacteroidaceae bacterium]
MNNRTIIALLICAMASLRGLATDMTPIHEQESTPQDYDTEVLLDGCDLDLTYPFATATSTQSELLYSTDYDDDEIVIIRAKQKKKKKKKRSFNSPRTKDFWGFSAGYTSKHWRKRTATGEEETLYFLNGNNLHGIQLGVRFNPLFKYGFGLDVGLFYEYYHYRYATQNNNPEQEDLIVYRTINEHVVRMPLHIEYRFNFSRSFQIFIFGGVAADYIISGNMIISNQNTNNNAENEIITDIYGPVFPTESRFNFALSYGGGLRFGAIQFNVNSARGIYNGTPTQDYIVFQDNPINITMSVMF